MKGREKAKNHLTKQDKNEIVNHMIAIFGDMQHYKVENCGSDVVKVCTQVEPRAKYEGVTVGELETSLAGSRVNLAQLDTIYAGLGAQDSLAAGKSTSKFTNELVSLARGDETNQIGYVLLDPRISKEELQKYGFDPDILRNINYRQAIMIYDLMFDIVTAKAAGNTPNYRDEAMKFIGETISKALHGTSLGMEKAGDFNVNPQFIDNLTASFKLDRKHGIAPAKSASAPAASPTKSSSRFNLFRKKASEPQQVNEELRELENKAEGLRKELALLNKNISNEKASPTIRSEAIALRHQLQLQLVATTMNIDNLKSKTPERSPRK